MIAFAKSKSHLYGSVFWWGVGGGVDTIGQIKGRDAYTGKKHLEQSYITGNIIKMAAVQNRWRNFHAISRYLVVVQT